MVVLLSYLILFKHDKRLSYLQKSSWIEKLIF